jgi:hypothetical protein
LCAKYAKLESKGDRLPLASDRLGTSRSPLEIFIFIFSLVVTIAIDTSVHVFLICFLHGGRLVNPFTLLLFVLLSANERTRSTVPFYDRATLLFIRKKRRVVVWECVLVRLVRGRWRGFWAAAVSVGGEREGPMIITRGERVCIGWVLVRWATGGTWLRIVKVKIVFEFMFAIFIVWKGVIVERVGDFPWWTRRVDSVKGSWATWRGRAYWRRRDWEVAVIGVVQITKVINIHCLGVCRGRGGVFGEEETGHIWSPCWVIWLERWGWSHCWDSIAEGGEEEKGGNERPVWKVRYINREEHAAGNKKYYIIFVTRINGE